jgi:hypothetical protein
LEAHSVQNDLWDIFTRFKIAGSRHVIRRTRNDVLRDDFDYGHKFSQYGLHLLQYDNVGFKAKGGYEQTVAIFWNDIPPSVLIKDGVYSKSWDRPLPHSKLPRAEDYLPMAEDYQELWTRGRGYITMMLKVAPHLPTAEELEGLHANYSLDSTVPRRLPFYLRSAPAAGVSVTAVTAELEVDLDPDEREDADADRSLNDPSDSHFDANYVKTDNVLFRDLNCTDCVLCICDYNMRVVQESVVDGVQLSTVGDDALQSALFGARMTVRADGVLVNQDGVGILPIHQHTGAISIGDGSPSYSIIRGMDEGTIPRVGPGGQDQPALYNSPGGFHMSLEMWKMWGALFRDSHLTTLVKTWRPSPGKLDWFLNPGDPRQTEDETEE